ncbi:sulfatase [Rhodopirellula sp. SM50]|nr:sulfatase [Rhodopirellula sp. SM50]
MKENSPLHPSRTSLLRREFFAAGGLGMGSLAMAAMASREAIAAPATDPSHRALGLHLPQRAKRVIYLFQSGAPSQLDLLDHKPLLNQRHGTELPASVRGGQRLTGMSGNQSSLPLVGSPWKFSRHGQSGAQLSELMPHLAGVADELCIVRSMHTEAINHGPGVTFVQTGSMFPGRPSMGAWLDYGLGRENDDLPSFVVMVTKNKGGQPLVSRLWGSGFLPSRHQGVRFRSGKDPVLYLNNPEGIDPDSRRSAIGALSRLHQIKLDQTHDPLVQARISQYELAYRMQSSIPDATNLSDEPESTFKLYGDDAKNPGTFAANCVLARRLAERGVRFIQLYHPGWDHHGGIQNGLPRQCRETDQPSAALLADLKQRGMLEDTLVIWGGEFGRTNYCQGKLSPNSFGRDHHPRCFSVWMAGGGIRPGMTYGATDEFGYNIAENPVHIHDLQATILHQLGIDHERLTFKYQGRNFRLTDVHGKVQHALIDPIPTVG